MTSTKKIHNFGNEFCSFSHEFPFARDWGVQLSPPLLSKIWAPPLVEYFLALDCCNNRRDFLPAAVWLGRSGDGRCWRPEPPTTTRRDGCSSAGSERLISGRTRFAWFPVGRIMTPQPSATPTDNDNRCPSTSRSWSCTKCRFRKKICGVTSRPNVSFFKIVNSLQNTVSDTVQNHRVFTNNYSVCGLLRGFLYLLILQNIRCTTIEMDRMSDWHSAEAEGLAGSLNKCRTFGRMLYARMKQRLLRTERPRNVVVGTWARTHRLRWQTT